MRRSRGGIYQSERLNLRVSPDDGRLLRCAVELARLRPNLHRDARGWEDITLSSVVRPWLRAAALEYLRTIKPAELERIPDANIVLAQAIRTDP